MLSIGVLRIAIRRAEGGASRAVVDDPCRRSVRSSVSLPERGVSIPTLSSSGFSPLRAVSEPELLADRALTSAEGTIFVERNAQELSNHYICKA